MHVPDSERVLEARSSWLETGTIPAGILEPAIEASWRRCRGYGLAHDQPPDYTRVGDAALGRARDRNRPLIDHARPIMEALAEQIKASRSQIALADSDGLIVEVLGEPRPGARCAAAALAPGVSWSERSLGTNGIGTALAGGTPLVVHGPEHYLLAHDALTCSATPILGPDGRIAGTLGVSGDWMGFHPHTMGLMRMSNRLIESQLFCAAHADAIRLRLHQRPEAIGTLSEGLLAIGPSGEIRAGSAGALSLLGLDRRPAGLSVASLFGTDVAEIVDHARRRCGQALRLSLPDGRTFFARIELPVALVRGPEPSPGLPDPQARRVPRGGREAAASGPSLECLRTGDPAIEAVVGRIRRVLGFDLPILIQGETGTGKELFARAIHNDSSRRDGPFVAVNCASIPEGLIESELFGYEEGAFTGARRRGCPGKIQMADGGTLFLDEIGDMPVQLQARLLRVLQERVVTPLGSATGQPVDIAVVCATHRKLKAMIAQGQFREDLYYRLNGVCLNLPPLRERTDAALVAERILQREVAPGRAVRLSESVSRLFRAHPWPGNLRQLHNVLRTAVAMAGDSVEIRPEHLPEDFLDEFAAHGGMAAGSDGAPQCGGHLRQVQWTAIVKALERSGGNVSATARELGISRNTIYRQLKVGAGRISA